MSFLSKYYRLKSRLSDILANKRLRSEVTHNGSTFYRQATIHNFQNDKSKIILGKNCHVRGELQLFAYGGKIEIGDHVFIGEGSRIWSGNSIKIGSHVLISHNVHLVDSNSHELNHLDRAEGFKNIIMLGHPTKSGSILTEPIIVEDYVWISFNVSILKGVHIGQGAIIAAGSVVTEDVPSFTMVAGNPARVIKQLDK